MRPHTPSPLIDFAYRLKSLRNQELATRLLWLAAEGRLEILEGGEIGFWTNHPAAMGKADLEGQEIELIEPLSVDPTWGGPASEPALWCAAEPHAINAVEFDTRGVPRLVLHCFAVKLHVQDEGEEDNGARARRKGPARLYARPSRRRAA